MAITHATSTGPIGETQWLEDHDVDAAALRAALNLEDAAKLNVAQSWPAKQTFSETAGSFVDHGVATAQESFALNGQMHIWTLADNTASTFTPSAGGAAYSAVLVRIFGSPNGTGTLADPLFGASVEVLYEHFTSIGEGEFIDFLLEWDGTLLTAKGAGGRLAEAEIDTLAKLNDLITDATLLASSEFSAVATTGAYSDLTGLPPLGTAATTDAADYATAAQGTKADNALPADGGTLQTYAETPDTLTSTAEALTIPLDGKTYTVTVTEDTAITFSLPASGRGSAIVHFIQDATGGWIVSFPAATEWADSTATDVATDANARTRAVLTQFSSTGVDADLEVRGTVA